MIKHTLTKKQQLVLCTMYVESLKVNPSAVQSTDGRVRILPNGDMDCSVYTMCYLQDYGLVGLSNVFSSFPCWALTPDGIALAKALIKVLS